MVLKNTLISNKDVKLLEEAIIRYGRIVTSTQLCNLLKNAYSSVQAVKNRISFLQKAGWLVRVKNGLYVVITDISGLGFNDISGSVIAQNLNKKSYISFENALQYYGMFDQMLSTVDSVTFTRARKYEIQNLTIRFFRIKKELYFGFTQQRLVNGLVNISDREKAILDMLYFRVGSYNITLIVEKLKEYKQAINFVRMKEYAVKYGVGFVRKVGFLLDQLSVDTVDLHSQLTGKNGYAKFSADSNKFNAKWRVYFNDKFII